LNIHPYLTPYKWGEPVLAGSGQAGRYDEMAVDCPFVFRHNGKFYMMHVGFDGKGYQTGLAVSDDLLHWEHKGVILSRDGEGSWDSGNAAGTWILRDNDMHGTGALKKWNNKYWLCYHAYPGEGYEVGPGKIGLAWTEDENLLQWHRLPDPILSPEEGEDWERGGLYKECLVEHSGTFYLFYNAKNHNDRRWTEQIGIATSQDLTHWTRNRDNPVLQVSAERWDQGFVSDPCVLNHNGQWAMFFFGYDYKHAQDGIALSEDLLHWDKYPEPIIAHGNEEDLDFNCAHKPSIISHNGVLYHFYCATRKYREGDPAKNLWDEFRTITVAASHPFR